MQATNLCFYSNKCQWSKAFLTELSQTPWKSQFRFICVDPGPQRPPLPSWLKKVPTLVIAGEQEPKTDAEVMNWLYEKKMKEGGGGGAGPGGASNEPEAFNPIENSSFFKGLSYVGLDVDTSAQGEGGRTMAGAFSFLGGAGPGDRSSQGMGIGAGPGGGPGPAAGTQRRSKKEEMFDKQMEQYQRERDMGMPKGPNRMGGGFA